MIETALANAKLNLSLDIISRRADGYHNMKTVMQSVSLSDEITLECLPGIGADVETQLPYLPGDEKNIAAKAALVFFDYTGVSGYHAHIRINKKIPVCAGLGGGSTDCACVLRMLNEMFSTGIGRKELETIGGSIGADVPFCINGGTALATGKGEELEDLAPIPLCCVVICKPPFSCSTPEVFGRVKCERIRARPDIDGMTTALETGDLRGVAQRMYNVFEDVLPRGSREIAEIKYAMNDNGALGASMTGSGPSVFGLFDDLRNAQRAYEHLRVSYKECFIAETTAGV